MRGLVSLGALVVPETEGHWDPQIEPRSCAELVPKAIVCETRRLVH